MPPFPANTAASMDPAQELLFNDVRLSRFAMECAREIYSMETLLRMYGLTPEQFEETIENSKVFITLYQEHREIWNGSTNQAQRVALKAGMAFEENLGSMVTELLVPGNPLSAKVELAKYLSKLAGFENVNAPVSGNGGGSSSGGATVIINLPHGRKIEINSEQGGDNAEIIDAVPEQVTQPASPPQAVTFTPPPVQNPDNKASGEDRWGAGRTQISTVL